MSMGLRPATEIRAVFETACGALRSVRQPSPRAFSRLDFKVVSSELVFIVFSPVGPPCESTILLVRHLGDRKCTKHSIPTVSKICEVASDLGGWLLHGPRRRARQANRRAKQSPDAGRAFWEQGKAREGSP